jgi:hypothetical protein
MAHFYELSKGSKQQCEAQAVQHFYATWQHSAIFAFRALQPRRWLEIFQEWISQPR